jgi:hypothetical protein
MPRAGARRQGETIMATQQQSIPTITEGVWTFGPSKNDFYPDDITLAINLTGDPTDHQSIARDVSSAKLRQAALDLMKLAGKVAAAGF